MGQTGQTTESEESLQPTGQESPSQIRLTLADGQQVTLVGGYEASSNLPIQSVTVDEQTNSLRTEIGPPPWAGRGRQ